MAKVQAHGVARWAALAALFILIALVPLFAGWMNGWTLFAFPFGTLVVSLIVPAAVVLLLGWIVAHLNTSEDTP